VRCRSWRDRGRSQAPGDPRDVARSYGWLELARRERFVLVFPEGLNNGWNDLGRPKNDQRDKVDDVAFVKALLADVQRKRAIDPKQIFATGHSNGGFFSYTAACMLPGVFAAIGPVAGSMGTGLPALCEKPMPTSVMHVHGTQDPLVPIEGGRNPAGRSVPVRTALQHWAKAGQCRSGPTVTALPDKDPADSTSVKHETYTGCGFGVAIELYAIQGAGHGWPGGAARAEAISRRLGRATKELDATAQLWRFFQAHPKR
jgi:polyhydroxybutyrate depolymerase